MRTRLFLACALGCAAASLVAQHGIRDTTITVVPITLSYAYQLPMGDMAVRFGANHNIGLSAGVKFKSNYYLGAEGSFIFGPNVKELSMLNQITMDNGDIVDQNGDPSTVLLYERGFTVAAAAGKVMPIMGPNPNSGLLLKLGAGYMQHFVRIESQNNVLPALEDDYAKGYDRLTAGPFGVFFVGYQHLGNKNLVNFVFGYELTMAFTHNLRPYNFDTGKTDDRQRVDALSGLRFGWTLPIYKNRDDRRFYR